MTNEEREKHLDWLYRLKSEIFVFMPKDWLIPFADALDVAIKALEQEPTTKNCRTCRNQGSHHGICEICKDNKCWTEKEPTTKNDLGVDCISREQAIKQCGFGMTSLLIADNLRKLPPVAPQSRKGHWEHGRELSRVFIGDALRGINYEDWHCSNCHCVIEQSIKPKWNYCPNCGADMREVKE